MFLPVASWIVHPLAEESGKSHLPVSHLSCWRWSWQLHFQWGWRSPTLQRFGSCHWHLTRAFHGCAPLAEVLFPDPTLEISQLPRRWSLWSTGCGRQRLATNSILFFHVNEAHMPGGQFNEPWPSRILSFHPATKYVSAQRTIDFYCAPAQLAREHCSFFLLLFCSNHLAVASKKRKLKHW